jgi:hypothetical protein
MDFWITLAMTLAVGFALFGLGYSIKNWNNKND